MYVELEVWIGEERYSGVVLTVRGEGVRGDVWGFGSVCYPVGDAFRGDIWNHVDFVEEGR